MQNSTAGGKVEIFIVNTELNILFQWCGWMDPYITAGNKQKWEVKI